MEDVVVLKDDLVVIKDVTASITAPPGGTIAFTTTKGAGALEIGPSELSVAVDASGGDATVTGGITITPNGCLPTRLALPGQPAATARVQRRPRLGLLLGRVLASYAECRRSGRAPKYLFQRRF